MITLIVLIASAFDLLIPLNSFDLLAFALIVYIKNTKQQILDDLPQNVDCNKFNILTEKEVAEEYKSSQKTGKIGCFCQEKIREDFNNLNMQFEDAGGAYVCLSWFQMETLYQALPWAIIFVIVFINLILQILFKSTKKKINDS